MPGLTVLLIASRGGEEIEVVRTSRPDVLRAVAAAGLHDIQTAVAAETDEVFRLLLSTESTRIERSLAALGLGAVA